LAWTERRDAVLRAIVWAMTIVDMAIVGLRLDR
jgi:hypothetical protein